MTLRRVHVVVFALAVWLGAIPAFAAPLLYSFTATLEISKTTDGTEGPVPAGTFEDGYWFPTLHHGQTRNATGFIEYDPSLFDENQSSVTPMVFVELDQWLFGISSSLGFVAFDGAPATGDRVEFHDTLPTVVRGPLPASFFIGEDADVFLVNPSGSSVFSGVPSSLDGFTSGTVLYFGTGFFQDPSDGHFTQTRLAWQGTIDSIQRVPEPSTVSLLLLGVVAAVKCRRRFSKDA